MSNNGPSAREYDIILYGATGYTGKLTAEYLLKNAPNGFRWAIAGRSEKKLLAVIDTLKELEPNRQLPVVEVADLQRSNLDPLVRRTRLVMSAVGPFHAYGTPVLAACAENAIDYVDCTGESPWVKAMISKYHDLAASNNTIMIPQCGIDSVPADLTTYLLVKKIRSTLNCGVSDFVLSTQTLSMLPSGGTINTALSLADSFSLREIAASFKPFALSPVPNTHRPAPRSWTEKLLGIRTVPDLGVQTDALFAKLDRAQVGRSWGLIDGGKYYGEKFNFSAYARARNAVTGVLNHFAFLVFGLAVLLPPVKWLVKKAVYQPGEGPERHTTIANEIHYRAAAYPDVSTSSSQPKRAIGEFMYVGSGYYLTGLLMVEAALLILEGQQKERKGGILTPATLGEEYAERLRSAGVKITSRMDG